jgi:hypothetical protein
VKSLAVPVLILLAVYGLHALRSPWGEPWKNNDETRHVMTGVFVRDAIAALPASAADPRGYAVRYYAQYPALGILVWPPLFYAVEGVAMTLFGTDYAVARAVLIAFDLLAAFYFHRLARRLTDPPTAHLALALVALTPAVFDLSRFVLLELPCLALILASIFHFERVLENYRARDAVTAAVFAALAALTRFDAVLLLPYFAARLVTVRRFGLLLKRGVLIGAALALALTAPYYWFTFREYSAGLSAAATTGSDAAAAKFLSAGNFVEYPSFLVDQLGWCLLFWAVVGAVVAARRQLRVFAVAVTLVFATYAFFAPMAECVERHVVYWVPAFALLAAVGLVAFARADRPWGTLAAAVTVAATAFQATWHPGWFVRGYADAAEYVVTHRTTTRPVLFEGVLTGGFVYQVRQHDPARSLRVLRGDKLLYVVFSDPATEYREFAKTDADILALVHAADPEYVVIEFPGLFELETPVGRRFRDLLRSDRGRFRLERRILFDSNHDSFKYGGLEVFRKLDRNPTPNDGAAIPVLGLGRSLPGG